MSSPFPQPSQPKNSFQDLYVGSKEILGGLTTVIADKAVPSHERCLLAAFLAILIALLISLKLGAAFILLVMEVVAYLFCVVPIAILRFCRRE